MVSSWAEKKRVDYTTNFIYIYVCVCVCVIALPWHSIRYLVHLLRWIFHGIIKCAHNVPFIYEDVKAHHVWKPNRHRKTRKIQMRTARIRTASQWKISFRIHYINDFCVFVHRSIVIWFFVCAFFLLLFRTFFSFFSHVNSMVLAHYFFVVV